MTMRRQGQHTSLRLVGALWLLVILTLAGCGVTVNLGGPGGTASSPPGGPGTVPGGGIGGTAIRPCTGKSVAPSKPPTIVLTVDDSYKTTLAHVGDVIEVQLDAMTHWSPPVNGAPSVLAELQPQGGLDEATRTCRWVYEATAKGTAKLTFTGSPICESSDPCPAIARAETFTIQVS